MTVAFARHPADTRPALDRSTLDDATPPDRQVRPIQSGGMMSDLLVAALALGLAAVLALTGAPPAQAAAGGVPGPTALMR